MRLIIILLAVIACSQCLDADTKTTRHNLKASRPTSATVDTSLLTPAADSLEISGYDKPLRSSQETLFVTNRCRSAVNIVNITITYLSVNGDMLHRRDINLPCSIPPGETRQIAFRSWDRQQAYYHHSTRVIPRSVKAIPYRTEITLNGAVFQD